MFVRSLNGSMMALVAVAASLMAATQARGANVTMQLTPPAIEAQPVDATTAFSTTFTGDIVLNNLTPAILHAQRDDGSAGVLNLGYLAGVIHLTDGQITGGSFSLTAAPGDVFTADILAGTGMIQQTATADGTAYNIVGDLHAADFNNDSFASLPLSGFSATGNGSFQLNPFLFDDSGLDAHGKLMLIADLSIATPAPEPASLLLLGAGLAAPLLLRRRQNHP